MRLRGQYAGGIEEVSNAMTLQIGGVDLSCSFLDEQGQQTRLYDFVVDALLEPPVRSLAIEVERVAACEGSSCPPPILRFPNLNLDGDAIQRQFELTETPEWSPRWNLAPGQRLPTLASSAIGSGNAASNSISWCRLARRSRAVSRAFRQAMKPS